MPSLVFALLLLAMAGHSSATWCVCKEGMGDSALQKTLDYACGAGADCNPIKPNGQCYNPNTVRAHCNYAVNSYFQKRGQAAGACDFASTASVTTSDPSVTGCVYPSSASSGGGGGGSTTTTSPTTNTPSTGLPSTSSTSSPIVTTPTGGSLGGGINNGLGPSGTGMNTDVSHGGISQRGTITLPFITLIFYAVASWWLE